MGPRFATSQDLSDLGLGLEAKGQFLMQRIREQRNNYASEHAQNNFELIGGGHSGHFMAMELFLVPSLRSGWAKPIRVNF